MKPKWNVFLQGLAVLLLSGVALLVLQNRAADSVVCLCGLGAVIWVIFGGAYLIRRRAGAHDGRSRHRRERDLAMLINFAVGLGLPIALAVLSLVVGPLRLFSPPLRGGGAVILSLSVVAVPWSMFVSSSVDWYLIRAFRDGVFGAPACQRRHGQTQDKTTEYVQYWIIHRFLSEGCVFLAIIGVIAEVIAICTNAIHSRSGIDAFNDIGIVGILAWSTGSLAKIKPAIDYLRYPAQCGLGAWQIGRNDDGVVIRGFCLDASLNPGIQLTTEPFEYDGGDVSRPEQSVPLRAYKTLDFLDPDEVPFVGDEPDQHRPCTATHCAFWIQHCERGNRQYEANAPAETAAASTETL